MLTPPAIAVRDVCFRYGEQEVLHNVSFEVPERAFVAVVGPNGGGKTTLLRLLLGAIVPRFGTIRVLGEPPAAASCRIGYVPQLLLFDPSFPVTVLDAVLIGRAAQRRFGRFTRGERIQAQAALDRVRLADAARRPFASLSGGQRQRVLIAQALVSEPRLLLLDEPTANVDAETEQQVYSLLLELNRDVTVVVVSHNLSVVTAHASHVLCVNRTVDLHLIGELAAGEQPIPGVPHLALIHHGAACQVVVPGPALNQPHRGDTTHQHSTPDVEPKTGS
jgi:zinc transport system ATP-binding protein